MGEMNYNKLSIEEQRVMINKGTESPFSGEYHDFFGKGNYLCKRCNAKLYSSNDKFSSACGWPSFDDEIEGAVKRVKDADGKRTEILCANCDAHLGHIFEGEGFTDKNIRHCVNSISLIFQTDNGNQNVAKAYFAGGCFWGVEYFFEQKEGVISVVSGYMGGELDNPTYHDVCYNNTGHLEVVEVTYDINKVTYEDLTRLFFEIHDPTQSNGQGPDIGEQYLSAVLFNNENEQMIAHNLIDILKNNGYDVKTKVLSAGTFWKAEAYHQNYYQKHGKVPYCHSYTKRF